MSWTDQLALAAVQLFIYRATSPSIERSHYQNQANMSQRQTLGDDSVPLYDRHTSPLSLSKTSIVGVSARASDGHLYRL